MPRIYEHEHPIRRTLGFALGRRREIKEQMEQLRLEDSIMVSVIEKFTPLLCPTCNGEQYVMIPIPGCECDGPRMHTCPACKGTGLPA